MRLSHFIHTLYPRWLICGDLAKKHSTRFLAKRGFEPWVASTFGPFLWKWYPLSAHFLRGIYRMLLLNHCVPMSSGLSSHVLSYEIPGTFPRIKCSYSSSLSTNGVKTSAANCSCNLKSTCLQVKPVVHSSTSESDHWSILFALAGSGSLWFQARISPSPT